MTRKDYYVIASVLAKIQVSNEIGQDVRDTKTSIDNLLEQGNPRYDSKKFWAAVEESIDDYHARYAE